MSTLISNRFDIESKPKTKVGLIGMKEKENGFVATCMAQRLRYSCPSGHESRGAVGAKETSTTVPRMSTWIGLVSCVSDPVPSACSVLPSSDLRGA